MQQRSVTRRDFLQTAIAAGSAAICPAIVPGSALGLGPKAAASNRVVTGVVGLGFNWTMLAAGPDVECVAICDVQKSRRDEAQRRLGGPGRCAAYNDFRELIGRSDIDAVYIATPDHWHALVTIAAAKAGKHVYCQKPLSRTIAEGQAVVEAINRHGVVFQHGTQQRHDPKMLLAFELVRNGYIGELKNVKIGSPSGAVGGSAKPQPVPPGVDWEMWLGPAPWSPFTPLRIQAHPWYFISDYCMGYIAGWGVHHADSAQQGSGLDDDRGPIRVDAHGIFPTEGLFDNPYRWQMHYTFANGVTWHWTDCKAGMGFGSVAGPGWTQHRMGITFEGTKGSVFTFRNEVETTPKSLMNVKIGPADKVRLLPPDGSAVPSFIECIKSGRKTCAPVEIAHRSSTMCSIGAIGTLLNRSVTWDPVKEEFIGDEEANRLRNRAMREPWRI